MADLTAIFGILILLGLSYPCLLAAWGLLFASAVDRARLRLEATPGRCFWLGLGAFLLSLVPILVLLNLPLGPAKFLGWTLIAVLLGFASVGGAGWAALAGARMLGESAGAARRLMTGALVSELAAVFPLVGWFLFLPYTLLASLGAAVFAALRWMPSASKQGVQASYTLEAAHNAAVPGEQG